MLSPTVAEVLGEMTDSYDLSGRSPHTMSVVKRAVQGLLSHVRATDSTRPDPVRITDVSKADVSTFLAAEKRRGQAPASLSITQRSLRVFFSFAAKNGYITHRPTDGIPSVAVPIKALRFLDDEQTDALLAALDRDTSLTGRRDAALIGLLNDTGMRRGELLGLRVSDLDLNGRVVSVRPETSKMRRPKAGAFTARTGLALRQYLRQRAAYMERIGLVGDFLWVGAKRQPLEPNGALQMLRRRLTAAGLPQVTLHSFRHRFAANAVRDGVPLPFLLSLGGWTSPTQVSTRYGMHAVAENALAHQHNRYGLVAARRPRG